MSIEYRKPKTLSQLEEENAKLRELVRDLWSDGMTLGTARKLKTENAKLRELVRDMWHEGAFQPGACYVYEAERLEERTRELGIEVDE